MPFLDGVAGADAGALAGAGAAAALPLTNTDEGAGVVVDASGVRAGAGVFEVRSAPRGLAGASVSEEGDR